MDLETKQIAITTALVGGVGFFIKSFFDFGTNVLIKHFTFKLEQSQKIRGAKTDLEVARLIANSDTSKIKADILKRTFLTRVNGIHRDIETLQKEGKCKAVRVYSYHNGTSKGFKFYSMKYEEVSHYKYAELSVTQNKPLSEYYTILERFKTEDVVTINIDSAVEENLMTDQRKEFYTDKSIATIIAFPLLILDSEELSEQSKIMPIEIHGILYYIVGALAVELDENRNEDYDINTKGLALANKLILMYLEDKNILG